MNIREIYFTRQLHCPDCNTLCLMIDNMIYSCPQCDVSLYGNVENVFEEKTSNLSLKFNKSSCT